MDDQNLRSTEAEIDSMEDEHRRRYISLDHKDKLTTLVAERDTILRDIEESWRLRSRAIWILEGDDNRKFYHKFTNGQKEINTIWHLNNE